MKVLYFFRGPIRVFIFGIAVLFLGALFKIRHWPNADELLTTGTMMCTFALLIAFFKIYFMKKPKE